MEKKYEYPAPANYPDVVNTDEGIEKLIKKSNLEALLIKMGEDGHDVSAPLVETDSNEKLYSSKDERQ
ncbi:hypothetical protein AB8849_08135 [Proteus vulgaris]